MERKILEVQCDACGSWGFDCGEDDQYYCNSCGLPRIRKRKEQGKERREQEFAR